MPDASHTHPPRKAETNWHQRYLTPSFVTCEDYQRFLDDTGAFRQPIHWVAGHAPQEGSAPVLGMYPEDARAFCAWLSSTTTLSETTTLSQETAMTWRLPRPGELAGAPGVQMPYGYWTRAGTCEQPDAAPSRFPEALILRALARVTARYHWIAEDNVQPAIVEALRDLLAGYTFLPARLLPAELVGVDSWSLQISFQREPVALRLEAAQALAVAFQHGIGDQAEYPLATATISVQHDAPELYALLKRALNRDLARGRYRQGADTSHLKHQSAALFKQALPLLREQQVSGASIAACLRQYHRYASITRLALALKSSNSYLDENMLHQALDIFVTSVILDERIAETLPAYEGIVPVGERDTPA